MNLFVRLRKTEALFEITGRPGQNVERVEALADLIANTADLSGAEVVFRWTGERSGVIRVYFHGKRGLFLGCIVATCVLVFDLRVTIEKDEKEIEEERWELTSAGWRQKGTSESGFRGP